MEDLLKQDFYFCFYSADLETLYDHLQRGDINSPSVYQTLEPLQAPEHKGYYTSLESFLQKNFLFCLYFMGIQYNSLKN